jgi:hypothetical protein
LVFVSVTPSPLHLEHSFYHYSCTRNQNRTSEPDGGAKPAAADFDSLGGYHQQGAVLALAGSRPRGYTPPTQAFFSHEASSSLSPPLSAAALVVSGDGPVAPQRSSVVSPSNGSSAAPPSSSSAAAHAHAARSQGDCDALTAAMSPRDATAERPGGDSHEAVLPVLGMPWAVVVVGSSAREREERESDAAAPLARQGAESPPLELREMHSKRATSNE